MFANIDQCICCAHCSYSKKAKFNSNCKWWIEEEENMIVRLNYLHNLFITFPFIRQNWSKNEDEKRAFYPAIYKYINTIIEILIEFTPSVRVILWMVVSWSPHVLLHYLVQGKWSIVQRNGVSIIPKWLTHNGIM